MHIEENQLREFILDSGLVSRAQINEAAKIAGERGISAGEALVNQGLLSEDDLRHIQAYVLGIPFISLKGERIPPDVLALIPEPIARGSNIMAFRLGKGTLEVIMLDVNDHAAIDLIRERTHLKILPRLTDRESMKDALLQYQRSLKAEFGDIIQSQAEALSALSEKDFTHAAEDLSVVRIVDTLLRHAITQGASDIHIEPREAQVLVRYRIHGALRDAMTLPRKAFDSILARLKILSNLKLDEKGLPQEGRFKVESEGGRVSFRVSTLPTLFGEKTVMRVVREGGNGYTLEALGFHGEGLESLHEALQLSRGMVLVAGPNLSGKTTTLYTALDLLNTPDRNISTIEDPVEYQMSRVNQTQVRSDIGLSFATGLRTLMRQDPDIVMVGEMRDRETVGLAVSAALTGRFILSSVNADSAANAIATLLERGAEPTLLMSALRVVTAQRLVHKLSGKKESYVLSQSELEVLGRSVDLPRVLVALKAERIVAEDALWKNIPFSRYTDQSEREDGARVGIHEVMPITPSIKDLVVNGTSSEDIEHQARKEGMLTMAEDGIFKAVQGVTTLEEVLRVISE